MTTRFGGFFIERIMIKKWVKWFMRTSNYDSEKVPRNPMQASEKLIEFLAGWEAVKLRAYDDGYGYLTIGIGHRLTKPELRTGRVMIDGEVVRWRAGITRKQAYLLKDQDLDTVERAINEYVKVPLWQHQFDALCSLFFNVGTGWVTGKGKPQSSIIKKLNRGDYDVFSRVAPLFKNVNDEPSDGLIKRRAAEVEIFDHDDYSGRP